MSSRAWMFWSVVMVDVTSVRDESSEARSGSFNWPSHLTMDHRRCRHSSTSLLISGALGSFRGERFDDRSILDIFYKWRQIVLRIFLIKEKNWSYENLHILIKTRRLYSMIHLFLLNFICQLHCAQRNKNIAKSYHVIKFIVLFLLLCSVFVQIDASEKDRWWMWKTYFGSFAAKRLPETESKHFKKWWN